MTLDSTFNAAGQTRKVSAPIAVLITLALLSLPGMPVIGTGFSGQQAAKVPFQSLVTFPSPGWLRSEATLAKGKFLVASRNLRDPNFSQTVVLLIDYDWYGAMGLVINRPSELRLSAVFPEIEGLEQRTDTVYIGGPVARSQILLLIRSGKAPEESHHVFEETYVTGSRAELERMVKEGAAKERFRVYAGHAGWAPGQLDREVSEGGWHVLEADAETLFDKAPSEIWPELIRRSSVLVARLNAPGRNARKDGHYFHPSRSRRTGP